MQHAGGNAKAVYIVRSRCWRVAMLVGVLAGFVVPVFAGDPVKPVAVSASAQETKASGGFGDFTAEKTIDGDLSANSSWRAEVKDEKAGQWIRYDLGSKKTVTAVRLAFVKGDERVYRFDIELSEDGSEWVQVFSGKSGGKSAGFETFELKAVSARYVRIRGFGNSSEKFPKWINIVETQILADQP